MNPYDVTGIYYTDNAVKYLTDHEMAAQVDGVLEVYTQPNSWDYYTSPEGLNPDVAEIYYNQHWGKSIEDVQRQITELGLPWVELPAILPIDEDEANHLLMLEIGAPTLPGLERTTDQ